MSYTSNTAAASLGYAAVQNKEGQLSAGPKPDPALAAAVIAINRQLTYANEAADRLVCAVDRMRPATPTTGVSPLQDVLDGTLLMALAQIENRVAHLASVLGDTANEIDRLV